MVRELTLQSHKILKSRAYGYLTAVLYMQSGGKVCPWMTKGCGESCLVTAGRGMFDSVKKARRRRTRRYFKDRYAFLDDIEGDIKELSRKALRMKLEPACRLDGTSDLGLAQEFAFVYGDVQFYDYTKSFERYMAEKDSLPNRHLMFSRSEENSLECEVILKHGGNVAVVFSTQIGQPLPTTWKGYPTIDGDVHDLTFLDPPGHVRALRAKGKAKRDTTGFVVQV